ncbi:hypothetical protein [Streptomyces sp. RerS4]|uniref:hypothetical protein n=1 Tax=Streptomyces sp. RerS4 TaxID=2942449 RepID=UPI00201C9F09|nr:hypothetical protein [Streptomyces sp. RerS4]UQW99504.1 hypothetical protein M4D82_02375 [Streptomyces sp. RerS4]
MTKFAWAARGAAAASVALLAGTLVAPSAAAHAGPDPKAPANTSTAPKKQAPTTDKAEGDRCETSRDVSSAVVDYGASPLFETVFRSATNRQGNAFLNDSRNPGVWINLGLVPGAPKCVFDTSVAVTEENPGHLFITLLGHDGVLYQARCTTSTTPFTPSNLAAACTPGFSGISGTPV